MTLLKETLYRVKGIHPFSMLGYSFLLEHLEITEEGCPIFGQPSSIFWGKLAYCTCHRAGTLDGSQPASEVWACKQR